MRINKFIAHAHGMSRREADNAIAAGRVMINGKKADMGAQVELSDTVMLDGKVLGKKTAYTYILLNKPVGYLCSRRSQGGVPTIYSLLPKQYQSLKAVGRLDKDSSGLMLLTDDGDLAFQMTHPSFHKVKVYEVELDKPLEPLHQQMISDHGIALEDGVSRFSLEKIDSEIVRSKDRKIERESQDSDKRVTRKGAAPTETRASHVEDGANSVAGPASSDLRSEVEGGTYDGSGEQRQHYRVTMSEGRNRQIRRTFAALGYTVIKLHRTVFGPYSHSVSTGKFIILE